jgi:hypothetical protein
MECEKKIKQLVLADLDETMDILLDANCKALNNDEEMSEKDILKVESIFMSYRNVIAGMDWNGNMQEYEKYKV